MKVVENFKDLSHDQFLELVKIHNFMLVFGSSGKDIPTCLHAGGFRDIVSSQIRRKVAISLTQEVSKEICCEVGTIVGYSVLKEEKTGMETEIKFATDGMLLRGTEADPYIKNISVVILDKAQEKTPNTLALINHLKKISRKRSDLRVLILGCDGDVDEFTKFIENM